MKPQYIDPADQIQFPGLLLLHQQISHFDWIYRKTPNFVIHNKVLVADNTRVGYLDISLTINKGDMRDVKVKLHSMPELENFCHAIEEALTEKVFWLPYMSTYLQECLKKNLPTPENRHISNCIIDKLTQLFNSNI